MVSNAAAPCCSEISSRPYREKVDELILLRAAPRPELAWDRCVPGRPGSWIHRMLRTADRASFHGGC